MSGIKNHISPILSTEGDKAHFVGFHDIIPWDKNDRYIALHQTIDDTIKDRKKDNYINLCIWDTNNGNIEEIDRTNTWNWQQGARIQWLHGKNEIIYNKIEDNKLVAKIFDQNNKKSRILPLPVYNITKDNKYAVSYNFLRLGKYWKGYGYAEQEKLSWSDLNKVAPEDDGLFILDLTSMKYKQIISVKDVYEFKQDKNTVGLPRFFTHASFSPNGKKICFFERFHSKEGGLYSRFFVVDVDGSNLKLLGEGKQSHFDWFGDDTILIWSRPSGSLVNKFHKNGLFSKPGFRQMIKLIRKLNPGLKSKMTNEYYKLFSANESSMEKAFAKNIITEDGHPMFSSDYNWLVNDTYPKADNCQTLMLYNVNTDTRIDIAELSVPEIFRDLDLKCDLHPRWNRLNTKICIDSAHSGKRQVYIFDVEKIINAHL